MEQKDLQELVDKVTAEAKKAIADETKGSREAIDELKKLVDGVSKVDEKSIVDYVKTIQDHVNTLETKMKEKSNFSQAGENEKVRTLNNDWVKKMLKKDKAGMKSIEKELETLRFEFKEEYYPYLQWPAHVLHTGGNSMIDSGDEAQGGVLIPQLFLAEVQRWIYEYGVARRDMRYLPFSGPGNSRHIPTLLTNVTVSWVDEGGIKPKTKPTFALVEQTLEKLAAIVIMTEEIIEDSAIDLISFCGQLLGEAIAAEEDRVFLAGDIGAGDVYDGVLNATGVVPVTMGIGNLIGALSPDHLLMLQHAVPTPAAVGGKYYMHRSVFALIQAYRASVLVAGDREGSYLVQSPAEGMPNLIWGKPVVFVEQLPSALDLAGLNDTPFMFFANLQKTCVYGDKLGLRVKLLDQASVYDADGTLINLAERDMLALRVHKRVGYVPVLPDGIAVLSTGAAS